MWTLSWTYHKSLLYKINLARGLSDSAEHGKVGMKLSREPWEVSAVPVLVHHNEEADGQTSH